MSLLLSTKIDTTKGSDFRVVRDWRVVMIPDDNNTLDVLSLYNGIGSHTFNQLEPFVGDKSVRAHVGRSQAGLDYQDRSPLLFF